MKSSLNLVAEEVLDPLQLSTICDLEMCASRSVLIRAGREVELRDKTKRLLLCVNETIVLPFGRTTESLSVGTIACQIALMRKRARLTLRF